MRRAIINNLIMIEGILTGKTQRAQGGLKLNYDLLNGVLLDDIKKLQRIMEILDEEIYG